MVTNNSVNTTSPYPISSFTVGAIGFAKYQTIQAALDAANTYGGGIVYVQPGVYTENLTFYPTTQLVGTPGSSYNAGTGGTVEIIGVHTPPLTGYIAVNNCYLSSATDIFFSAAAGAASIVIENTQINCTAGYTFNLVNWTGLLGKFAVQEASTTNGVVNNTGGAQVFFQQTNIGAGTANPMIVSGQLNFYQCEMNCPITFVNGTNAVCSRTSFIGTITAQDVSNGDFRYCQFSTGSDPCFYQGSTGAFNFVNCSFDSNNNPCIDGVGTTGTLTLCTATFANNAIINPLLVTAGGGGFIPGNFGTAGQVLTSNGLGVVPSWQAGGGGGGSVPAGAQLMFIAYLSSTQADVTGDGTQFPIVYDTAIVNVGGCYDTNSGIFTAPTSDIFMFQCGTQLADLGAAHTAMNFTLLGVTTFHDSFYAHSNPYAVSQGGELLFNTLAYAAQKIITTGDQLKNSIGISNGTKVVDITGDAEGHTWWAGYRITPAGGNTFPWSEITAASANMSVNTGYIANYATLCTLTLPTTAALGSIIEVVGKGAGGWQIAQNANQMIHINAATSTTGVGGYLSSNDVYNSAKLLCTVADLEFTVLSSEGTLNLI